MDKITKSNIEFVRNEIFKKVQFKPYEISIESVRGCITDMDHFPYTRYYRGEASSDSPVVFEREAGWRARRDDDYFKHSNPKKEVLSTCFETSCNVMAPCCNKELRTDIPAIFTKRKCSTDSCMPSILDLQT